VLESGTDEAPKFMHAQDGMPEISLALIDPWKETDSPDRIHPTTWKWNGSGYEEVSKPNEAHK
jgi:hypothetical protein